jgi:hypothetical protein
VDRRAPLHEVDDALRHVHHLLEVVEQEQHPFRLERTLELLERGLVRARLADRADDRLERRAGVAHRREVDEEHAVREPRRELCGRVEREPGLPDAARTDQRDEPRALVEGLADPCQLFVATEEHRRLRRQVVRTTRQRRERWELGGEPGRLDLVDPLGLEQVLEPVTAEIAERDAVR